MADLSMDSVYRETCASIRASDDISFKLIGVVPLLSGASLLTLFFKDKVGSTDPLLVVTLCSFAALITLGLFRWELRNVQRCNWYLSRAKAFEKSIVRTTEAPDEPRAPSRIGKTQAEKCIYSVTILAWLSMPVVISGLALERYWFRLYVVLAVAVALLTALSCRAYVQVGEHDA